MLHMCTLKMIELQQKEINLMAYHMMTLVPSYQKVPKVKIACSNSKEGDLY